MTTWSWGDIVAPSFLRLLFPYLLDSKHKVTTNIFFFAAQHSGSSLTRDRTHPPALGTES